MNRYTLWLWQRALAYGACAILFGTGLVTSAQEAAPATGAAKASAEQLQNWLAELDSDSFEIREAAAEKLAKAGPAAVDVLARGIVSESAETAWRSGASLERIALTGDEKTLARITSVLDSLSAKGKPGLRSMAAEMHVRQKHFRHDRAVASLKQNGAVFAGDGMQVAGGPMFIGGPVIVGGPIMVEEAGPVIIDDVIEAFPEPVPAKEEGIFGLLGRLLEGAVKVPDEPLPKIEFGGAAPALPPADLVPLQEIPALPAEPEGIPAREETPAIDEQPADEKPANEKPANEEPAEPARLLEEFKKLTEPVKKDVPAVAPPAFVAPPALVAPVEILGGADIAIPFGLDFIGGGIIGLDEGEVATTAALMLGKQWRGGDEGLRVLKDVPEIWSIAVNGAKISDASLLHMAELPNLNNLQIRDTNVTREGLRKLREQKPELQVQARGEAMMGVNADIGTTPLVLTSVFPNSGAHLAGLREGDVIHTVDGIAIKDFADLTISIYGRRAGDKVRVEYERGGAKKTLEVTLKKRADDQ